MNAWRVLLTCLSSAPSIAQHGAKAFFTKGRGMSRSPLQFPKFHLMIPEKIPRRDPFHVTKQGVFRDFIASSSLLMCWLGYFHVRRWERTGCLVGKGPFSLQTVLHSQQVQQVATSKGELNRPNVSCIFCTAMGYGLTVIVLVLCTNHYMSFWWHTICFHFCHFIPIRSRGMPRNPSFIFWHTKSSTCTVP